MDSQRFTKFKFLYIFNFVEEFLTYTFSIIQFSVCIRLPCTLYRYKNYLTHICTNARTLTLTYPSRHAYLHAWHTRRTHTHVYAYLHARTYAGRHTGMHTHAHTHAHAHVEVCEIWYTYFHIVCITLVKFSNDNSS